MRGNPSKLDPYLLGKGTLTPEQEREIRSKGGKACARRRQERKTAIEALQAWLESELTNAEMAEDARSVGTCGEFAPVGFDAVLAGAIVNTIRKGTADDVKRLLELAGVGEDDRDEDAHKALLDALTAEEEDGSEHDGRESGTP